MKMKFSLFLVIFTFHQRKGGIHVYRSFMETFGQYRLTGLPIKISATVKPSKATELSVVFFVVERLEFSIQEKFVVYLKKIRPSRGNGTASNDCLPYEKCKKSLFVPFRNLHLSQPLTISCTNDCCCMMFLACIKVTRHFFVV